MLVETKEANLFTNLNDLQMKQFQLNTGISIVLVRLSHQKWPRDDLGAVG